jgi:quinol monooxygenase YgiN
MAESTVNEIEIVRMPVSPGRAFELFKALDAARSGYLGPPQCHQVDILVNAASDEVAVIITWDSEQAHAAALRAPAAALFFAVISGLATGAPEVKKYTRFATRGA